MGGYGTGEGKGKGSGEKRGAMVLSGPPEHAKLSVLGRANI